MIWQMFDIVLSFLVVQCLLHHQLVLVRRPQWQSLHLYLVVDHHYARIPLHYIFRRPQTIKNYFLCMRLQLTVYSDQ